MHVQLGKLVDMQIVYSWHSTCSSKLMGISQVAALAARLQRCCLTGQLPGLAWLAPLTG